MEFLKEHQLNIMLILSGVCLATAVCGIFSVSSKAKKIYLFVMDIAAALLMLSDRFAYIYRGDESALGFWMVRVCNFLVFFLTLLIVVCYNGYLIELCKSSSAVKKLPNRLRVNKIILFIGVILLVISQFTGLYYTFDVHNQYQRSDGYIICYLIPVIVWTSCVSVMIQFRSKIDRRLLVTLILFCTLPIIASVAQFFLYGLSLTNIMLTILVIVLRVVELTAARDELAQANRREKELIVSQQESARRLFEQTAAALVNAIDAKDTYTHGHSLRVAKYSKRLAELNDKSDKECEEIYYTALVHDVGKIGIPEGIINKDSRLTDEEYAIIKAHPVIGFQILDSISEFPELSIGAHYHHERYDGKGYPEGLKGEEIPETARIIAVADAYDAMTSKRSYRDPIPQQKVREELVKGVGTQFDPEYARLMLHLIDEDLEYQMSEREEIKKCDEKNEIVIGEYRSVVSDGILLNRCMTTVTMSVLSDDEATGITPEPSLLLFDSLDGKMHTDTKEIKDLNCFEYGEITNDLQAIVRGARKIEAAIKDEAAPELHSKGEYKVEAARIDDHALIRIYGERKCAEFIIALPDSSRFLYIGFTGEHCCYTDIVTVKSETELPLDYIPRIAEKISYIADAPRGDIPNVQIDGYRYAHSKGIEIKDGLTITFHAKCLPTARLVWHCPCINIFCSDDGEVNGANYRDLAFMRFDGEFWESDPGCHAELNVIKTADFEGWEAWKEYNRNGYDATVTFKVEGSIITIITENAGISISNTAIMTGIDKTICAALTGDQVAITNIHISQV
ncbi:MAG: HD-GYP domain-containing protein [Ruminiclostridium sp.]|nr:HD-GYP domain-containing protein [Ruminiclostridium sp.]